MRNFSQASTLVRLETRGRECRMPEPAAPKDPQDEEPAMVSVARYSGLGLQLAVSVMLFLFGGSWLDGKLGTRPWLTLIGAFVGAGAGFYSLYVQLVKREGPARPKP